MKARWTIPESCRDLPSPSPRRSDRCLLVFGGMACWKSPSKRSQLAKPSWTNFWPASSSQACPPRPCTNLYTSFGDDPFVVSADPKAAPIGFSAWAYARERCEVLAAASVSILRGRVPVQWNRQDEFIYVKASNPLSFKPSFMNTAIVPETMYTDGGSVPQILWGYSGAFPVGLLARHTLFTIGFF